MKILMVNKFLYPNGGSETYIFKLGEYLAQKGHDVQYFGMEHEGRCVGNAVNAYTKDMDFHGGNRLEKLAYPIKTIYSIEARKKIRLVLDDFKPDVVHLNNINFQLTPSIILEIRKWKKTSGTKVKIVFTAHDYQLVCPNHMLNDPKTHENCEKCRDGHFMICAKNKCIHGSTAKSLVGALEGYYWNLRTVYKYIDAIVCPTEFLKSKMDKNPFFKQRTVMLRNFAETSICTQTEKKDYVLYFGRFSYEKGFKTLIEVCKQLPEIPFVFAGSGPLQDEMKGISNIHYIGFLKGDALKSLISEARFSVYPSEWYENCPFSVMESQIYGTPVLGADIGGIPELIQDHVTGELFKSGDQDELKKKIEKLWTNTELIEQYSKNCKLVKFNTLDQYLKEMIGIYQEPIRGDIA